MRPEGRGPEWSKTRRALPATAGLHRRHEPADTVQGHPPGILTPRLRQLRIYILYIYYPSTIDDLENSIELVGQKYIHGNLHVKFLPYQFYRVFQIVYYQLVCRASVRERHATVSV